MSFFLLFCLFVKFILLFLYKVATGQLNSLEDTREYKESDEKRIKKQT